MNDEMKRNLTSIIRIKCECVIESVRDIAELKVILLQIELVTDSIKLKYVQADNRIAREFNF